MILITLFQVLYIRFLQPLHKEDSGFVATLVLGLQPRQGLARLRAKREAWGSHLMLPGVQKSVKK
jgi:hypothetical protein